MSGLFKEPARITNPSQAQEAHRVLAREHSTPRGHRDLRGLRQSVREEVAPNPRRLDADQRWFFPGLAYCMVGVDRSLFALFEDQLKAAVRVTTHRTGTPVSLLMNTDVSDRPWFHTLQGIDRDLGQTFVDFIETFRFRDQKSEWALTSRLTRIADPFVSGDEREAHEVVFLLPVNLTLGLQVCMIHPPGLHLATPVLGVRGISGQ